MEIIKDIMMTYNSLIGAIIGGIFVLWSTVLSKKSQNRKLSFDLKLKWYLEPLSTAKITIKNLNDSENYELSRHFVNEEKQNIENGKQSKFILSVKQLVEYLVAVKYYVDNKIMDRNEANDIIKEARCLITGITKECIDKVYKTNDINKTLYNFYNIE